ncbi:MAG: MotA/TolQ/ExbB proton channel family protein [Leptolyngbyaceae bacterium]|nr:MotA/TolQ/ExbB proton channel family protein [Leptolyngbyaceae bacterium]
MQAVFVARVDVLNVPWCMEFPIFDLIVKGGPVMVPLVGLSILTIATSLERGWFWYRLLSRESQVVQDVMAAARVSLEEARAIAEQAQSIPIGRFLLAPLSLKKPSPETFQLALEAAGDKEFVVMRKGDKFLETVVALAPLMGLLGTVTGLILTFNNLNIGSGGSGEQATAAAAGIGEALITTAAGMVVAIVALIFFRIFLTLQSRQVDYFSAVGSELELIYRQIWYESAQVDGRAEGYPASVS